MGATTGGGASGGGAALRFVGSDSDGLPLKRKQVQQACVFCRKRKKRCTHGISSAPTSSSAPSSGHATTARTPLHSPTSISPNTGAGLSSIAIPDGDPHRGVVDEESCQVAATQLVELSSRFVGDLNPEGVFIEATAQHAAKQEIPGGARHVPNKIGIWLSAGTDAAVAATGPAGLRSPDAIMAAPYYRSGYPTQHRSHHQAADEARLQRPESSSSSLARPTSDLALALERAKTRFLTAECLATLPPLRDYQALEQIFMDKIHPIFPIFTAADLAGKNPDPVYTSVVRQIVSLTAGMDRAGRPHLRLEQRQPQSPIGERDEQSNSNSNSNSTAFLQLLSPQDFHQRLSSAIFPVLDANWIHNRVDTVRILSIMALFFQPFSPSDRDRAALLSSQAVHHLQNLGAHLEGYRPHPQRQDEDIDRVFCAVWAVDRLCASIYARPVLIHERDVERDLESSIERQPECFRLFLKIIQILDRVFPLYRPRQPFVYTDVPVFESLIMDTGTGRTPTGVLATLETLYHAVSVLSCRQQRSAFSDSAPENDRSHLPDPAINPRRSLSADRIIWAVQNEELGPFPFVPYAVSLALSVQYRKMRYSRTLMFRNRARGMFQEIVRVLARMGGTYYSARVNAGLGESILREMEKTAVGLAGGEVADGCSGTGRGTPVIFGTGQQVAGGGGGAQGRVLTPASGLGGGQAQSPGAAVGAVADGAPTMDGATLCATTPTATATTSAVAGAQDGPQAPAGGAPAASTSLLGGGNGGLAGLDPSVFDNLDVDVDLFGYFDPNFNLGAVDTALEANLNMGFPVTWAGEPPWSLAGA